MIVDDCDDELETLLDELVFELLELIELEETPDELLIEFLLLETLDAVELELDVVLLEPDDELSTLELDTEDMEPPPMLALLDVPVAEPPPLQPAKMMQLSATRTDPPGADLIFIK